MTPTVVGYGKLSRAWNMDMRSASMGAGDTEVRRALDLLSRLHPEIEWRLVTRNSGERPTDVQLPPNVTNPWRKNGEIATAARKRQAGRNAPLSHDELQPMVDDLTAISKPAFDDVDDLVLWIGHHGSSNSPLPAVRKSAQPTTRPYDNFILYGSYLLHNLNAWRDQHPHHEEIWLCADPRNYIKARDLKWPITQPIIAQHDLQRETLHYRYGMPGKPNELGFPAARLTAEGINWAADVRYEYDSLELAAAPHPANLAVNDDFDPRYAFGIIANENKADVKTSRAKVVNEWINPMWPECEIFGKWSDKGKAEIGRAAIKECPYQWMLQTLTRWRSTLTTPASGSGWATAKPWECFAAGVVCFFHPKYDTQGHILADAPSELNQFLRVTTREQLWERVSFLDANPKYWREVIHAQRDHYEKRYRETNGGVIAIERRLGLV